MQANPEFAEALGKGEAWAVKQADAIRGIDGESYRRHPERAFTEDGVTRRNWCGSCPFEGGCVCCDLDGDHKLTKNRGKLYKD